jgi:sporulation protein YlmC with PRC-barrel domain
MDKKTQKNCFKDNTGDRMRVNEQMKGKEVIDSFGMTVGKIKDIEVNWDTNEIEAIVLGKGGISESLGLSKEENIIPYDMVKQIGDKVLLKENINEPMI